MVIGEIVRTGPRRLLFFAPVIPVLERPTSGGGHNSLNDSFLPLPREKGSHVAKY